MCVCRVCVCPPGYLRHFMSVLGISSIVGTFLARASWICTEIKTITKQNKTKTENIAETMVLTNYMLGIKKHLLKLRNSMIASY